MRAIFTLIFSAFIALGLQAQFQENVDLVYTWSDPTIPFPDGSNWVGNTYNDVWGVVIDGKEYAICGSYLGTHFIDISDPANINEVQFVEAAWPEDAAVHRDFHDHAGFLYTVCDEGTGQSTMQVIDMRDLPNSAPIVYDSNELLTRAHNIFVDTAHAVLYAVGATSLDTGSEDVMVIDISDPSSPQLKYNYNGGYVHDIYVRDNIGYLNQANQGLFIVEFGENDYTVLGSITDYPEQGYNHSGWLSEDGNYYVLADETHATRLKIFDVSDPTDIQVVSLIGSDITPNSIAHNLIIRDQYIFVSYYYDGLQIFDMQDPANPIKVAQYDTFLGDNDNFYRGMWGVYPHFESEKICASDMQTGLWIFDVDLRPAAHFDTAFDSGSTYNFEDESNWQPTTWNWTVSGVSVSTDPDLNYTFTDNGTYTVCLEVSNAQGSDITCEEISVNSVVGIEDSFLSQTSITQVNNALLINFPLETQKEIAYTVSTLDGRILASYQHIENAGSVNRVLASDNSFSNGIIIVTLQSDEALWSQKLVWTE